MNKDCCNSSPKLAMKKIDTPKGEKIGYNFGIYVPTEETNKNADKD
jgi:hypothetical protein